MLLVKRDVSVWHEAQVLTLALLTSCEYSWAMNELQRGHIQVRACRRGWLYWTILSHFCLTCESFSSPCWFWPPACQLNCSEHGRCDSFTKRCVCDPFWMENFLRVQMGDGESNCGTWTLPRGGNLGRETPPQTAGAWNPGWAQCQAPAVSQLLWWDVDSRTQFLVSPSGQMMFDRGVSPLQTLPVNTH